MKLSLKEISKKISKYTSKISFEWIYDKRVLVILSVVISIVFWFYITLNVSPSEEKTFADVPVKIDTSAIEAKGLTLLDIMDTTILGDKTYTVPVVVEGNRYTLTQIDKEDISVVAQLTSIIEQQPNNYTLALKVTCDNSLYDVTTKSSVESITVKLDVISSQTYSIRARTNSTATTELDNYSMESPSVYIGNEKITEVKIEGPQAVIKKVDAVEVFCEGAQGLTQTTDFDGGKFILYDENGNRISGTDLNYVAVTAIEEQFENIPVSDAAVTVRVPLRINAVADIVTSFNENRVGEGFNFSRLKNIINYSPSSKIAIKYTPNIDKNDPINDIVNTLELKIGKIDLTSITPENNVYTYTTTLPAGIELTGELSGNEITVEAEFDLSGYTTKTLRVYLDGNNFTYDSEKTTMNIAPPESIKVTFVGPKNELSKLTEDNISEKVTVIADVSGVSTAGTVSLPVNIHVNGKTNCWVVGTDEELSLSVTVSEPTND